MKNFGENPQKKLKSLKQEISILEEAFERVGQIMRIWEEKYSEQKEIITIINGLYSKLDELQVGAASQTEQPKTDEAWEAFISKWIELV